MVGIIHRVTQSGTVINGVAGSTPDGHTGIGATSTGFSGAFTSTSSTAANGGEPPSFGTIHVDALGLGPDGRPVGIEYDQVYGPRTEGGNTAGNLDISGPNGGHVNVGFVVINGNRDITVDRTDPPPPSIVEPNSTSSSSSSTTV